MALLRSPDGSEELEVSDDQVEHYVSLGATVVSLGAPPRDGVYTGAPDEGLEANPRMGAPGAMEQAMMLAYPAAAGMRALPEMLADPTEIPGMLVGASGFAPISKGISAVASRMGSATARAGSGMGGVARRFLERRVPGLSTAKDLVQALGEQGAAKAGSAASRTASAPSAQYGLGSGPGPRVVRAGATPPPPTKIASTGRIPMMNPETKQWYTEAERKAMGLKVPRAKGSAASRVKATPKMATPPGPTTIKVTPAPKGSAASRTPRGASTPELARRQAARTNAIGRPAGMGDDNLEELLQRSIDEAIQRKLGGGM